MRVKLACLNDCTVPYLSRAATKLCWYYYTHNVIPACNTKRRQLVHKHIGSRIKSPPPDESPTLYNA